MADKQVRVIVVDDEMVVALSLCYYLEDHDCVCTNVQNGHEAIEKVKNEHFDLAIVDARMPGCDGHEIILEMHRIDPRIYFILHTGSGSYRLPQELKEIGMTDKQLFKKPVLDLSRFLDVANQIMGEQ